MREGTDILAAGWQLIALYFLFRTAEPGNRRWIVAAGIGFGLPYLIRYTSLVMLPVGLFYLWLRDRRFDRRFLLDVLALIIPFLLITAPQLIISLQVKGTPFYNRLAKNIWFGIYGNFDWPENWAKIPPGITLIQIIQNDPLDFLGHLAKEFGRIFWYDPGNNLEPIEIERNVSLWNPLLVHLLWLASSIALWWDKRINLSQKFLLAAALFIPVLAASMAWLFTRFLLIALCLQVVLIVLALTQVGEHQQLIRHKTAVSAILIGTTLAIFLLSTNWHQKEERVREVTQAIRELNPILTAAGASHPSDVISNNRLFQTTQSNHDKYENFNAYGNDPSLPLNQFLEKILTDKNSHYLIFDWTSHAIRTFDYQAYRDQLIQAKSQLVPIYLSADHSVYCLYPCNLEEMNLTPLEATENFQLLGYNAYLSQAGDVQGIYLYWSANSTVSEDYRFDAQLLDDSGKVLFQRNQYPHQGTYLTESWDVEKPVVDFFFLTADGISPDQEYEIVIQLTGRDGDRPPPLSIPIRFSVISALAKQ